MAKDIDWSGKIKITLKRAVYFRLLIASLIGALALSLISLFCLVQISDMAVEDYRYGYLMYLGRKIEKNSHKIPVTKINLNKYPAPPRPTKEATFSLLKVTELIEPLEILEDKSMEQKVHSRNPKPALWLVTSSGEIISSNTELQLPVTWMKMPRPRKVHGMESTENMIWDPKTFIIKLNTIPTSYLVTHNEKSLFQVPFLWIQGLHVFTTAALSVFMALSICFYYLRKKSFEARQVLARLESGDLKSRFEIKRFDQFGNLILDFNRMADEIERLVKRLNDTEASRSNLLQELGHDLRTPLTSMGTSFEALKLYHDRMNDTDREELFQMIDSDIRYFKDLLDKLTIIATIDESHYKLSSEQIDLSALLEAELKHRQALSAGTLNWNFLNSELTNNIIWGDIHLISRLFKNAFDNASRYANGVINVEILSKNEALEILVTDDGPGLTPETLKSFGKRRERRQLKDCDARNFSLGLGSVIMRSIAEAHDGTLIMDNAPKRGACLKIIFKRNKIYGRA